MQVAQHVLTITKQLKVMIAQRPGFTAPTLLARQLATLEQFYGGRVSLHVITGGNAIELRQDGNSRDMLNPILPLIQHICGHFSLQAGDVILTGTPEGIGPMVAGERVSVTVEGLGTLSNPVVDK